MFRLRAKEHRRVDTSFTRSAQHDRGIEVVLGLRTAIVKSLSHQNIPLSQPLQMSVQAWAIMLERRWRRHAANHP